MKLKAEATINKLLILFASVFVFISMLFSLTRLDNSSAETASVIYKAALIGFMAAIISVTVFFAFKFIKRLDEKQLKISALILFLVFALIEVFVLTALSSLQTNDSYRCIDVALLFLKDNNAIIDSDNIYFGYFCNFSNNNLFIMILYNFFKVLKIFGISSSFLSLRILNAILIFTAVVLAYLSVKFVFGRKNAVKVLLLLVLNPTLYIHIEWVYTLTFSLPIMMAILYFGLRLSKEKSLLKIAILSAAIALLTIVGYLIRPTAIFPLFALIVVAVTKIRFNKEFLKRASTAAAAFLLVFVVSFSPIKSYSNARFEKTLEYNFPLTHWVMMGLNDYGILDLEDVNLTNDAGDTKEEKQNANIEEIKKRVSDRGVSGMAKLFVQKINNTFTEGTHDIELRARSQNYYSSVWSYVLGKDNLLFTIYCQGFRFFTYVFMLICLAAALIKKKNDFRIMPFVITILGGFAFYILWETKQGYSLPFTIFMLVLTALGMNICEEKIALSGKAFGKVRINSILTVLISMTIVASSVFVVYAYKTSQEEVKKYDYSVRLANKSQTNTKKFVFSENETAELSQEFYTDKALNYLKLYANVSDELTAEEKDKIKFDITIFDESEKFVKKLLVSASDFTPSDKFDICVVNFETVPATKYQKYTLDIKQVSGKKDSVYWAVTNSYDIDYYKGDLVFNNESVTNDLVIEIGNKTFESAMSKKTLAVNAIFLITPQLLILLLLVLYKIKYAK